MSLDSIIKDILGDVEKLKEIGTSSEILDEITVFTIPLTLSISGIIKGINEFDIIPVISPIMDDPPTAQNTGSFLVGTARVGFSDAA